MKEIRIVLEDKEYQKIIKVKEEKTWKELLLSTIKENATNPTNKD